MNDDRTKRVEEVLGAYVEQLPPGTSIDVDDLVSRHPDLAVELREGIRAWQQLLGILKPRAGRNSAPDGRIDGLVTRLQTRGAEAEARYEVLHEIGRGGMGVVLEVRDRDLRRTHAMKVITAVRPEPQDGADRSLGRFLEEAQITAQLEHPGIVPVYEVGIDVQGRAFYTMPRVRGQTLAAVFAHVRAATGGWSITRAIALLLKVCEAMAYAHSRHIVHRDLKPTNVMVGPYGELYVMDWGLARVVDAPATPESADSSGGGDSIESDRQFAKRSTANSALATLGGDVVGTPSYMPPEQARGELAAIGPTTDVYAVGAMLYELLAGTAPYAPAGAQEILDRIRRGPPCRVDEIARGAPDELVAICERAMAWDRSARYADMRALADDLRAYLEGRVVRAHRTGAWVELKKWVRRNRAFATALAVALLATIVGLAAFLHVANDRRRIAQAREQDSLDALTRFREMADPHVVRGLIEESDRDLWPCRPERVGMMQAWLARAEELVGRLDAHRAALEQHRRQYGTYTDAGGWSFADAAADSKHAILVRLVDDLERLARPDDGVIAKVRQRMETARDIDARTIDAEQDAWNAAVAAVGADPRYSGLELTPQVGLVPLGSDPQSGFLEFWQAETGARPQRDESGGPFDITGESGMVLVLLPGGTFTMGAQSENPDGPNYDPDAIMREESPLNEVTLAPFFLSKYEMTQGQWVRVAGSNPSKYPPGFRLSGRVVTESNPVDSVTWFDCRDMLARIELTFPTEAQWEYAARAGTTTPWSSGADKESLQSCANLADESCRASLGQAGLGFETWTDGHIISAPAGSFEPNAFGLHDVHGNLWEWCAEAFSEEAYRMEPQPGDGRRLVDSDRSRVFRGGSFSLPAVEARSSQRYSDLPSRGAEFTGVRPARAVVTHSR